MKDKYEELYNEAKERIIELNNKIEYFNDIYREITEKNKELKEELELYHELDWYLIAHWFELPLKKY